MTLESSPSPQSKTPSVPDLSEKLQRKLDQLDSSEKKAQAREQLVTGQAAFERGRYKKAIAHFQTALQLSNPIGMRGGEIQLWLVNAYIAAGEDQAGLALCRKLIRHPDLDTQRQSKRLLYILEAPELELKPEWTTKIPDLSNLDEDNGKQYAQKAKKPRRRKPKPEPEPLDLSQVNTEDNQFVWIALIGILLTLIGLIWLS
ncbi:MAG: hypothetical protein DCF25_11010 [Leptolyngbya foveolarum]|uniref:Tetratricopeptide repeat protein n=1 Tax=Leptolyngbya foveolarum TaxID=47253 RepID=A0A2W4UDY3_9CYAN|nr:MAG: hypothetical protein DCF25_11010 [Leptolyngbya foveolarum]